MAAVVSFFDRPFFAVPKRSKQGSEQAVCAGVPRMLRRSHKCHGPAGDLFSLRQIARPSRSVRSSPNVPSRRRPLTRSARPITSGCGRRYPEISRAEARGAHLGCTSFDILGGLIKVLGQVSEHISQVGLPRCIGQSPGMVGLVAVVGCAVHTRKTPRCVNHSPLRRTPCPDPRRRHILAHPEHAPAVSTFAPTHHRATNALASGASPK